MKEHYEALRCVREHLRALGRVEEHERVFQGARGHVKKSLEVIESVREC